MVINCMQCDTEYRLNGELFQEAKAKGVQTRCRKCGCSFDVLIIPPSLQDDEETHQLNFQFAKDPSI
jgi:hypothetical protein